MWSHDPTCAKLPWPAFGPLGIARNFGHDPTTAAFIFNGYFVGPSRSTESSANSHSTCFLLGKGPAGNRSTVGPR